MTPKRSPLSHPWGGGQTDRERDRERERHTHRDRQTETGRETEYIDINPCQLFYQSLTLSEAPEE